MNTSGQIIFHPIISSIQKVALYETKSKLYLVGSNTKESKFRILEIDRTRRNELVFTENHSEIEARDIRRFVGTIGFTKVISSYGIIGFVRFLEGYYLILVTKRTRCAVVGMHIIYTIKDTVMVRVNESSPKQPHPLEQKYLKLFSNIDLKSNFYFSYSYDLTRSLQYNEASPAFVGTDINFEKDDRLPDWNQMQKDPKEKINFAIRGCSRKRFIWNDFLLRPMANIMLKDWMLEIVHGFVSQSNISIFGRPVYVCLIARRSTRFAGTRFLKRGSNFSGDVANEVETEQIVTDGHRKCGFVQMRGSIPSHWSQDISKMVPKPAISLDLSDPFGETAGRHYERLLFHFGAPIVILNLVKKREKRKHESILSEEMHENVKYLNQFLPSAFKIKYIHFDMARKSRGGGKVMDSLADIAENVIHQTGMYFDDSNVRTFQTGIVRVNCVDCLDRTNTAQFAIGKCTLGHQLANMGFIKHTKLEFDSDCVAMLESLYEEHGDTLALQYGGSQLVHRIKTYRKTAAWTSQGNDIMQTLSRYYSNTFSDTEKQHSINLFLGYFIPDNVSKLGSAIWDLPTDYYMDSFYSMVRQNRKMSTPLTCWINPIILKSLPHSSSQLNKVVHELIRVPSNDVEMIDSYSNYYLPYRLTAFEEHIAYQISQLARNFMPTFRTNFSPFEPTRRREGQANIKNPSMTGQSSSSSTTSSTSSSMDDDSSSDEETLSNSKYTVATDNLSKTKLKASDIISPPMNEVYGTGIKSPEDDNLLKYKKYVQIERFSNPLYLNESITHKNIHLFNSPMIPPVGKYSKDSYESVAEPNVALTNIRIYSDYVNYLDTFGKNSNNIDTIEKYFRAKAF